MGNNRMVDRGRNRTVRQDVATSDPKWVRGPNGTLVRRGAAIGAPNANPLLVQGGFRSAHRQDLQPRKDAPISIPLEAVVSKEEAPADPNVVVVDKV